MPFETNNGLWEKVEKSIAARPLRPELHATSGARPTFPDEERIKAMLAKQYAKESNRSNRLPPQAFNTVEAKELFKTRESFTESKIEKLLELGFSDEQIEKALEKEVQNDILKALNDPRLMTETNTDHAMQNIYNVWKAKQGLSASGAIGGAPGLGSHLAAVGTHSHPVPGSAAKAARITAASSGGGGKTLAELKADDEPSDYEEESSDSKSAKIQYKKRAGAAHPSFLQSADTPSAHRRLTFEDVMSPDSTRNRGEAIGATERANERFAGRYSERHKAEAHAAGITAKEHRINKIADRMKASKK